LDQLASGEFSGVCPHCGADLYLVIGTYGFFATTEDWVSRGNGPGTVQARPEVKRSPIKPARGALPDIAKWLCDRCVGAEQLELANSVSYLFGTSECTSCGKGFAIQDAIANA
jgi:hypothetical protein